MNMTKIHFVSTITYNINITIW